MKVLLHFVRQSSFQNHQFLLKLSVNFFPIKSKKFHWIKNQSKYQNVHQNFIKFHIKLIFNSSTYIFRLQLLVGSANHELLQLLEILVQSFFILQAKFFADDFEISNWIHFALNVSHISVFKSACDAREKQEILNCRVQKYSI